MKRIFICSLCLLLSGHIFSENPKEYTCSPVKNGKICYSDDVAVPNHSKANLFDIIHKWAIKNYRSDILYSNISSNKNRGSILISSKIELLLNETEKTFIKFRLRIQCYNEHYTIDVTDIVYQYDPLEEKRFKTYPAEKVILQEGTENTIDVIKNPLLFCEATYDFAEKLMSEVFDSVKKGQ